MILKSKNFQIWDPEDRHSVVAKAPEAQTTEKPKAAEEVIDEAGYNYRKSKKAAFGMFLVACAAFFGRFDI